MNAIATSAAAVASHANECAWAQAPTTTHASGPLPERGEFVIRGAHVISMDPTVGDLPRGDLHVRNGEIVAVGPSLAVPEAETIDASGMILMPGFVDTHWHLWSSTFRALIKLNDPRDSYFPLTLRLGKLCTPEDSYRAVRLGLLEALLTGITTLHNWSHNVLTPAHADAEVRALQEFGIRGRFSYGWGQDLPVDRPMDMADIARIQRQWFANSDLLQLGVAMRTPVAYQRGAVDIDVLKQDWNGARSLGLPITMHTRQSSVATLERHGLLGPDVQLVHPQALTLDEIAIIAARKVNVSASPIIEMLYSQSTRGEIQFAELLEAGVQQSLSVDTVAAAGKADFFAVMRALISAHGQRFGDKKPLSPRRLLELATLDGARALNMAERVGSLTPGKRADVILLRTADVNMTPMGDDPAYMIVFAAQPANVDTVIVDGRVLVRNGQLTSVDVTSVMREASNSARELRARDRAR
ncbi:MAG: amidohydrolase family protein [Kaiparowitsia implicata GSE-PSE-MK54-09C]|nr:amidohydrolase family protein [Kaiparowitsia implicata GSE-PSE-MK54-09C]